MYKKCYGLGCGCGRLEVVKFLHFNRTEGCTTSAMDHAATNGRLEVVKFLHFNRTEGCTTSAMDHAAMNGHIHIVKFLHFNRTEGHTHMAIDYAAKNGHLHIVEFLQQTSYFPLQFIRLYYYVSHSIQSFTTYELSQTVKNS